MTRIERITIFLLILIASVGVFTKSTRRKVGAQATSVSSIGNTAPVLTGTAVPSAVYTCNGSSAWNIYYQQPPATTFWMCDGFSWTQIPGVTGPAGPSGATLIGTCTVTQTAAIAIALGPRTVASTCTGVISGGNYFLSETAASLTANPGYGIFAGSPGTATNTLQVTLYGPLLAIGANYTISYVVYKIG